MSSILACVDFSDVTPRVMQEVENLARSLGREVHLLHVVPHESDYVMYSPGTAMPTAMIAHDTRVEMERIQKLALQLNESGIPATSEITEGAIVADILSEADRLQATHIIMGSHGHGALYELVLGSTTEAVIRKAKVPVLVVPSQK